MTTYHFPVHSVKHFSALSQSLVAQGINDATITMNGHIDITTGTGTIEQCQAAIDNAVDGSLISLQVERLAEVDLKSTLLSNDGALFDGVHFPIVEARFDFSYYESLVSTIERTPSRLPFTLQTVDGVDTLSTLQQVKDLSDAATDRIRYIYLEQQNSDLSYGELGYIIAIKSATDISELNAIIDTRV